MDRVRCGALLEDAEKSIDNRVSRHEAIFRTDPLRQERTAITGRGRKMVGRQASNEPPIHLLRVRAINVPRTKTRFNVAYRNSTMKSRQRTCHRSCGIPLYQDQMWLLFLQNRIQCGNHARTDMVQRLIAFHDTQVIVNPYSKLTDERIEQVGMLRGTDINRSEYPVVFFKLPNDRRELDDLRTGTEYR